MADDCGNVSRIYCVIVLKIGSCSNNDNSIHFLSFSLQNLNNSIVFSESVAAEKTARFC